MIEFIPLQSYAIVINTMVMAAVALLALLVIRQPQAVVEHPGIHNTVPRALGEMLVIALCVLVGLRPISYAFGDMGNYYKTFLEYAAGAPPEGQDPLFYGIMWLFAQFDAPGLFFLLCALVYLLPLRLASQRVLGSYWALGFLFLIAHVSFYGFAVNGIRNGMAMSLFTLAITYRRWRAWLLMAAAIGLHGSLVLPVLAYAAASYGFKARWSIAFWIACLVVSLAFPGTSAFLATVLPADDRLEQYAAIAGQYDDQFSSIGFRWDFLLYSALPIVIGAFFIFARKRFDPFYLKLFSTYVISNAVWLLLIELPFSNRFAYLSWGIMGLVIAYPLIKWKVFRQQQIVFALLLVGLAGFSYISQL
jgi:hypothetical protein